ncbi:unnamed protein product (mitochondrion) [Plasmodiophora brassicae]|uniref:U2A'/phosphoprotein 32 family A C-terminal domain-containing protein n=1 Tax=Plasmodiophora brassicae TaxID=37360 RepID=A0A3P3Y4T2_PLABS|nr:unnamed protein product [Plasmodiophora brassicae]
MSDSESLQRGARVTAGGGSYLGARARFMADPLPTADHAPSRMRYSPSRLARLISANQQPPPNATATSSVSSLPRPVNHLIPVVSRSASEKGTRPDRLTLNGRGLMVCPTFVGEERLQLLSFENNFIRRIERLTLPNLIFLDFHNNGLQSIAGLDSVPLLRVLLLGQNNLTAISGLEQVPMLDVLDLHSNNIPRIENVQHLKSLRVLNLESNRIERIENLSGMSSLSEINLSHNEVFQCCTLTGLPNLSRAFLTNNRITSSSVIDALSAIVSLRELTLRHNPICSDPAFMMRIQSGGLANVMALDVWEGGHRPVTRAPAPGEDVSAPAEERADSDGERQHEPWSYSSDDDKSKAAEQVPPATEDPAAPGGQVASMGQRVRPTAAPWTANSHKIRDWWEANQHNLDDLEESTLPSFYQFQNGRTKLAVFGFGFQALDLETASDCTSLSFQYVPFNNITPFFSKFVAWANLRRLEFSFNNIVSFYQLDSLSVFTRITEVLVSSNPIATVPLHRLYLVFRLPNLTSYNEMVVTPQERAMANEYFSNLRTKWRNQRIQKTKGFLMPVLACTQALDDGQHADETLLASVRRLVPAARSEAERQHDDGTSPARRLCVMAITMTIRGSFADRIWPDLVNDMIRASQTETGGRGPKR